MGLLPEREPTNNRYENPEEASPLKIERKEVITPVSSQFKAKVTDDHGQNLIESVDEQKVDIVIPEVNEETLTQRTKGNTEDSSVWSAAYWLRLLKKAIFFGWKVLFERNNLTKA